MIEIGRVIAVLMLEQVHADKRELRGDPREDEKQKSAAPVHDEKGDESGVEERTFEDRLAEKAGTFRFPIGQIGRLFSIHRCDGGEGKKQNVQRIPAEADEIGADEIELGFRVFVMTFVVSGNDACRRLADCEGQRDLVDGVPETTAEDWQVHLVVGRSAADECQWVAQKYAHPISGQARPISCRNK